MHIGFILDGNRRWAKKRLLPKAIGHKKGIENFENIVKICGEKEEIQTISAFALSTENLQRSEEELKNLFEIFSNFARKIEIFIKNKVHVRFLGNISLLPQDLQEDFQSLENHTKVFEGGRLNLNVCIAFGGRDEIVRAAEKVAQAHEEFTEENIEKYLDSRKSPPMDLLIRTGGKKRISNFMIWEAAYAELYFSEKMWPEFLEEDLEGALEFYKEQKRTFGK